MELKSRIDPAPLRRVGINAYAEKRDSYLRAVYTTSLTVFC
jgi:hypothetical protein